MSDAPPAKPSFSPALRFNIGFDVLLRTALVLAVVAMVNYLSSQFYHRFYLSLQTETALSSRTLAVVQSITNHIEVTLYYDTRDEDNFYPTIRALLNEYHAANKNITVRTVDYLRDAGEAEKVKAQFNLPGAATSPNAPPNKDLVIFACGNRHDVVPGDAVVQFQTVPMDKTDSNFDPHEKELQFRKKPVQFNGEVMFTSKLLALANAQPFKAYFLQGDGESLLTDNSEGGFSKFGLALAQNDVQVENLELSGKTDVPADCNLLIIAAPVRALSEPAVQKIDQYLSQGGRLFALFNYASINQPTGLEPILQRWGVNIVPTYVKDPQYGIGDQAIEIRNFNQKTFLNPLSQLALEMVLPRPVAKVDWANPPANAPEVNELAYSSDASTVAGDPEARQRRFPLIASVEQKPLTGPTGPRGSTRIVVTGDSLFVDNQLIVSAANRDFVNYAVNWLLNRQELLTGISPRPVTEYRLMFNHKQGQQLGWLLLGALPGGALVLGGLVWLVRRK